MRILLALVILLPSLAFGQTGDSGNTANKTDQIEMSLTLAGSSEPTQLRLRPTQVWSRDASIAVHSRAGTRYVEPPNDRYYAGEIIGEPGSHAVLRIGMDGKRLGLVASNGGSWMIHQDNKHALHTVALHEKDLGTKAFSDHFDCDVLTPPSDVADFFATRPLQPDTESTPDLEPAPPTTRAALYEARVAVETDHELFNRLGGTTNQTSRYIADLFAFISGIYETEVDTALTVSHLSLWEDSNDPWTQTGTSCALNEFGYYWNNNRSDIDRTIAHFISGKNMGGGVAWLGVLCNGGWSRSGVNCPGLPSSGEFGGAYGVSANVRGSFNPDDPRPVWDFTVIAHEIGHNFNSPHTHCYGGIGGNAEPVDNCYGGESRSGCFTGNGVLPDASVSGSGTIMSYCHLLDGGQSNISPTFGLNHPYGNEPERVPNQMFAHVQNRANSNPSCLAPQTVEPGFRIDLSDANQAACISNGNGLTAVGVQTQAIGGFGGNIALRLDPASPAGISASFVEDQLSAGSSTQLNLSVEPGASAGSVQFNVVGTANGVDPHQRPVQINLLGGLSEAPTPGLPANNADDLLLLPTFSWARVTNAEAYRIQLADNAAMTNPLINETTGDTQWQISSELRSNQDYYWRLRALSDCGNSGWSDVYRFTTGTCATPLSQGFESAFSAWQASQGSNGAHWAASSNRSASGSQAAYSRAPGAIADRQLTSPQINLPANADVQLRFDSWMSIEAGNGVCWDGALLEIAIGDGAFSPLPETALTTRGYSATVGSNYGNPAAGLPAWCGESGGFESLGADLSAYAGQSIRLRWRVATDESVEREGWYIDNISLTSCGGNTSAGSHALSLRVEGSGQLVSASGALQCNGQCQFDRPANETITLLAEPNAGHMFDGWLDECAGSAGECALTMDQARSGGARFRQRTQAIFSDRFQIN